MRDKGIVLNIDALSVRSFRWVCKQFPTTYTIVFYFYFHGVYWIWFDRALSGIFWLLFSSHFSSSAHVFVLFCRSDNISCPVVENFFASVQLRTTTKNKKKKIKKKRREISVRSLHGEVLTLSIARWLCRYRHSCCCGRCCDAQLALDNWKEWDEASGWVIVNNRLIRRITAARRNANCITLADTQTTRPIERSCYDRMSKAQKMNCLIESQM